MSEATKSGSPDLLAVRRAGNQLWRFAEELLHHAKDAEEYSRNLERANGGDETEMSKHESERASILLEIANAAIRATGL